jgi:hypothetical protein
MPNMQLKFPLAISRRFIVLGAVLAVLIALAGSAAMAPKAGAYLHVANCRDALTGGNGDNDLLDWMYANGYTNYEVGSGSSRYDDHRLLVAANWYDWHGGNLNRTYKGQGYCLGDDNDIRDRANTPPSGW